MNNEEAVEAYYAMLRKHHPKKAGSGKGLTGAGSGNAAREHLAAGRPICYWDDALQGNVREWPDGRRELVKLDDQGVIVVLRSL